MICVWDSPYLLMSKKIIISIFHNEVYSDISSQSILSMFETLIVWFSSELNFHPLIFLAFCDFIFYFIFIYAWCFVKIAEIQHCQLLWISYCTTHNEKYTTQTTHVSMAAGDIQGNHRLANELRWNLPLLCHRWAREKYWATTWNINVNCMGGKWRISQCAKKCITCDLCAGLDEQWSSGY